MSGQPLLPLDLALSWLQYSLNLFGGGYADININCRSTDQISLKAHTGKLDTTVKLGYNDYNISRL